jgi:hypothetical protein
MVKTANGDIQAFPIHEGTYVGTPSGYASGCNIIHAAEDCDITFDFGARGIVVVSALAGQDLAVASGIESITATATCWIS